MSAALQEDETLPNPVIGPHTIEEWLDLPSPEDGSRIELIFGHLHVTPPPSGEHQVATYRLTRLIDDAIRAAGRTDLYVVPGIGVKISSELRTALIPDVVILDRPPAGVIFPPDALITTVEVWSPGNRRAERETKMAAYAAAGVPFVWTVEQKSELRLIAHRLDRGEYLVENIIDDTDGLKTITAAPVPITIDLASLTF
jgi:Uma2 family endonuclease